MFGTGLGRWFDGATKPGLSFGHVATKRWLVDGMNVIGSRPDRWWEDRRGAIERLSDRLAEYGAPSGDSVTVVFDARPFTLRSGIDVVFAPGGPDAADDAIVRIVSGEPEPHTVTVVTSDRRLLRRVEDLGAETEGATAFLARLEEET
jgi:predicted RNA-binding protein with PIN domain